MRNRTEEILLQHKYKKDYVNRTLQVELNNIIQDIKTGITTRSAIREKLKR